MGTVQLNPVTFPWLSGNENHAGKAQDKSLLGKDDFLRLLVTELKYQDPLDPMKDRDFIAQMATFSTLEQSKNLNNSFEELTNTVKDILLPGFLLQQATTLIGREVRYRVPVAAGNEGATETEETILSGIVKSVSLQGGKLVYLIGDREVEQQSILEVGNWMINPADTWNYYYPQDQGAEQYEQEEGGQPG